MPSDTVSVVIDGTEFVYWSEIALTLSMDGFGVVELGAPFEADRREFRETFRPFTFKPIQVLVDGELLFTGTLVGVHASQEADRSTVKSTGYSLPGVLGDCTGDPDKLPIEFRRLGLKDIATVLAEPFGVEVVFDADEGAKFKRVKLEIDDAVLGFIAELARQRNLVVSDTPEGKLLCRQSVTPGDPVARFTAGQPPVTAVKPSFGAQRYFSQLTGFSQNKRGRRGSQYTVANPWLPDVVRPHSFRVDDTESADVPAATLAKMGRMFANAASWSADLVTWRDPQNRLWEPNTTVTLEAPNAMVYRETELIVRSVSLYQDAHKTTSQLDLVLPGAFSGEIPKELPWDG